MRHAVSVNQLVLWPRHEISEAWAPTGIKYLPQPDDATTEPTTPERRSGGPGQDDAANRGLTQSSERPATTVLTQTGGVCAQARRG
jgi:hypothetical protein